MPAPQALPDLKHMAANAKPSDGFGDAFSRYMRSEITLLATIALLIFVVY